MERLTKRENGHAHYQRCFEEPCGGMGCRTEDCEFNVEICERLAAYEDTGLEPEQCAEYAKADREGHYIVLRDAEQEGVKRLRELAEADKEGRVAVLPCKPDGSMLNTSDPERPEIMKRIHFAVAYVCDGIVFHQPYNIFLENIAAGYIRPLNEAEKALEEEQNDTD